MFKQKSNKTLGIVLVILGLLVLYLYVGNGGRKERTFNKNIVSIDTSAVTVMYVYPKSYKGKEIKLFKDNGSWKVQLKNGKTATVPASKMETFFRTLANIKAKRLVAKTKEKWKKYEVGENATRVKLMEGNSEVLNIVLGKFSFSQPREINSYVRLSDNPDVYVVEGFLEGTFNHDVNYFRNNKILSEDYQKIKSVKFEYPKESFTLSRFGKNWTIGNSKADSAETVKYIRSIARLTSNAFVDSVNDFSATKIVTIELDDSTVCRITAAKIDSSWIINSSENPESYFDGAKDDLYKKIFISQKKLLK